MFIQAFQSLQDHLLMNRVDFGETPRIFGPWLEMDVEREQFVGNMAYEANMFLSRTYREPFVIPDKV